LKTSNSYKPMVRTFWLLGVMGGVLLTGNFRLSADLRDKLIEHITKAQSSIDLVVYEIRSNDIADALIEAKRRAVRVRVIVDSVHSPIATPQEKMMEDEGIAIRRIEGGRRDLLHDKFILFDGTTASTPSYNRSAKSLRGEGNMENAFTSDKALISRLKEQFDNVWSSSFKDAEP
jgi:phosphatidylserine/phosphatidylglycerophosphate/cardiolipin synthase-like enzyme